jgi:hypothetical protein
MGTITTFYAIAFSCFPHRVLGVFAQAFVIYIFGFFYTGFFKDSIHSMWCSSFQGGGLQNICLVLTFTDSTGNRQVDNHHAQRTPDMPLG